jgi:hypothetical protein
MGDQHRTHTFFIKLTHQRTPQQPPRLGARDHGRGTADLGVHPPDVNQVRHVKVREVFPHSRFDATFILSQVQPAAGRRRRHRLLVEVFLQSRCPALWHTAARCLLGTLVRPRTYRRAT